MQQIESLKHQLDESHAELASAQAYIQEKENQEGASMPGQMFNI
jgi:hypothetical protein